MKKKKNVAIVVLIAILAIIGTSIVVYRLLQDENQLTVSEKRYITENKSNLISINVLNNSNVFGSAGIGVFYDYLESFEKENNLTFNIVTKNIDDSVSGLSLTKGHVVPANSTVFYVDHYVLVGKEKVSMSKISDVKDTIGILNRDVDVVKPYLSNYSLTFKNYESKNDLLTGLQNGDIKYVLVPMMEYLDSILDNLYSIEYHLSDIKDYYYMINSDDEMLSSIMNKFFNKWSEEKFQVSLDENEYELFIDKLKITEKELDVINNKEYNYGFIDNVPYDVKTGGTYGGIMNVYLEKFTEFSGIVFNYNEYSKYSKLISAINNGKVDLFANYYSLNTSLTVIDSLYNVDISFIMNNGDNRSFQSFESIKKETVYAEENSLISEYLKGQGLDVVTYKNDKECKKLLKNDNIVAMDRYNYLLFKEENDLPINERFRISPKLTYDFVSNNDTMFNRLFTYYISTLDKNQVVYEGLYDYENTVKSGTIIYKITKYAFILILIVFAISFTMYKFSKKVFIRKKIKRADKIKYIDMLTSLKNRNFLTENLPIWNQNTIYPQAIVVIDLNEIQSLNDTYGYSEGDKQIQSAANALIKTQLDNSEIMRTDGNEFTVYLIGYTEKQILSYIKKLNKEFKNLPHDKGAAIGFSMIEDDLKLIDDAINEATERMKENKGLLQGDKNEEKL